jgi:hypothetical protein
VDRKCAYSVLVERPENKYQLEDLSIDDRIILKCTSKNWAEES